MSKNGIRKQIAAATRRAKALERGAAPVRRKPVFRELALHYSVADFFRTSLPPDVVWLHVPNGEARDERTAAKLKRMGVLAGAPDFLLFYRCRVLALELKAPGGTQSLEQVAVEKRLHGAGVYTSVCVDMPGVEAALRNLGFPVRGRVMA